MLFDGLLDGVVYAGVDEFAETAAAPAGLNHGLDDLSFVGIRGVVVFEETLGVFVEGGLVFGGDEIALGIDAVAEGVPGRAGFAFGGSGSGRFCAVAAIGVDLFFGGHDCGFLGWDVEWAGGPSERRVSTGGGGENRGKGAEELCLWGEKNFELL